MRFSLTGSPRAFLLAVLLGAGVAMVGADVQAAPKPPARTNAQAKPDTSAKTKASAKAKPRLVARAAAPVPLLLVDGKPVIEATVAYVIDQDSGEVLLDINEDAVRPIASLTKLMTGMVLADAQLPADEEITIVDADVDRLKNSSSRLKVGTTLTRAQALQLTLMSSENRAAHALARTYPGGSKAFIDAMNNKARQLGMDQTHYVDASGLSSRNRSSARDLALLADAAHERPVLRKYSTSPGYRLGALQYVNSNKLVREGAWPIGLQKTGFINEAGQCLVMQTQFKGRNLIMVFLDSDNKATRIRDAELVRRWLGTFPELARAGNGKAGT
jgi:D-alanyl-D-alanine endopeptidase (penicillin-binding protein 7)